MYLVGTSRGLGDTAQGVQMASGLAAPVLTGALAAHAASTAAATGSSAAILGMAPALAVPIIGAAIVGITIAIVAILRSGCGQACIVTSQWANQAEKLLEQNIQAYFALPAPRTESQRNAALNNFEVVWARLQQLCGQQGTGQAGVRCITDRQQGACVWKQRADSPLLQYPHQPQPGECWNWFSGYRDPIAMDSVIPDPIGDQISGAVSEVANAAGVSPSTLMLLAAALLVGVVVFE